MLIEVDARTYQQYFPNDPHPFISETFTELNRRKVDRILRLANSHGKVSLGLVAGVKNRILLSPFSAPFGGFHFRNEILYVNEIDDFILSLKSFIISQELSGIEIILPPDIYHQTFNAKTVNSLIRNGFKPGIPDITGFIDLHYFKETFSQKNSREYYRQALRNRLKFGVAIDQEERIEVYELIRQNRAKFGRPIFMSFEEIINTSKLWPVDFFKVLFLDNKILASAIFYQSHSEICYAVFWGDNELGRPLRAMDFLAFNLWLYYKKLGYRYIDLGISTETGQPNEGLLRFKESHESISSLRYRFSWYVPSQLE